MLVELGVAIEFGTVLATPTSISFSPFLGQTFFFLLFQQLLRFLLHLALHGQLVLSGMIRFLCLLRLHVPTAP